ncbi:unnamed protein product [Chrysoparadoxa australica]
MGNEGQLELLPLDLLLFDRPCTKMSTFGALICLLTKRLHQTHWDHVGVVVQKNGQLCLLEASFSGVKCYEVHSRIAQSSATRIAVRRLDISPETRQAMSEKTQALVEDVMSQPYKEDMGQLLRAAVNGHPTKSERRQLHAEMVRKEAEVSRLEEDLAGLSGSSGANVSARRLLSQALDARQQELERIKKRCKQAAQEVSLFENVSSSPLDSGLFCSELVAAVYQRGGLLGAYPSPSEYLPCDFSSEQQHGRLHLLGDVALSRETFLRGTSPARAKPAPTSAPPKVSTASLADNAVNASGQVLLVASVAGAVGRCAVAPLERLKILQQTCRGYDGIVQGMRRMWREGGVRSLWRGNGLNILRIGPVLSLQWYLFSLLERSLSNKNLSLELKHCLAGGLSACVANLVTLPLEVVRARVTVHPSHTATRVASALLSREGWRGFLRGLVPTTAWAFIYISLTTAALASFKPQPLWGTQEGQDAQAVPLRAHLMQDPTSKRWDRYHAANIKAGALGVGVAAVSQLAAHPFDLMRRRLQVDTQHHGSHGRGGMIGLARHIFRKEGIKCFYRGSLPMVMKCGPSLLAGWAVTQQLA